MPCAVMNCSEAADEKLPHSTTEMKYLTWLIFKAFPCEASAVLPLENAWSKKAAPLIMGALGRVSTKCNDKLKRDDYSR